ncbi:hypothetical protein Hanom_Chr08g00696151 [Helianthus anomalus]
MCSVKRLVVEGGSVPSGLPPPPPPHSVHPNVNEDKSFYFQKSKLSFWYLRFDHFSHFSPKLKPFASGSLWFQFYCYFGPKMKSGHICLIKPCNFVIFLMGKSGYICLIKWSSIYL